MKLFVESYLIHIYIYIYIKLYNLLFYKFKKKLYYVTLNYFHFYYYKIFGKNLFYLVDVERFAQVINSTIVGMIS